VEVLEYYDGTTYTIDALTREMTFESTPGVNRVKFIFEPIDVTVETLNADGSPLDGTVWIWGFSPTLSTFTYVHFHSCIFINL
jgi:hypothetical protein